MKLSFSEKRSCPMVLEMFSRQRCFRIRRLRGLRKLFITVKGYGSIVWQLSGLQSSFYSNKWHHFHENEFDRKVSLYITLECIHFIERMLWWNLVRMQRRFTTHNKNIFRSSIIRHRLFPNTRLSRLHSLYMKISLHFFQKKVLYDTTGKPFLSIFVNTLWLDASFRFPCSDTPISYH